MGTGKKIRGPIILSGAKAVYKVSSTVVEKFIHGFGCGNRAIKINGEIFFAASAACMFNNEIL